MIFALILFGGGLVAFIGTAVADLILTPMIRRHRQRRRLCRTVRKTIHSL